MAISKLSISLIDRTSEAEFSRWFAIRDAAESFDRGPDAPRWPEAELRAALQAETEAFSTELYLADTGDGAAVGAVRLDFPLKDNRHRVEVELFVVPQARRHGIGTELLDFVKRRAGERQRTVLSSSVYRPLGVGGSRETSADVDSPERRGEAGVPGVEFARRQSAVFALGELRSECPLPLDTAVIDGMSAEARELSAAYEIRCWQGPVPDEFVDGWAVMESLVETEAPTGELDLEPGATTAVDIREQEDQFRAQGRTSFGAVALNTARVVVAYSQLVHSSAESMVYQWGTLVKAEARGHRLGMALKAAAARMLTESGLRARAIITYNAESNEHMLAINRRMGFRPVERLEEIELKLPEDSATS